MKSKMGKEGSKKCDNKKAVRAMVGSKDCWHRDFELSLTSRGQDQASDCLGSFSFLQIPSQKSVGQTPLDRSTTSQAASFVRRGFTKGVVPPHPSSPPRSLGPGSLSGRLLPNSLFGLVLGVANRRRRISFQSMADSGPPVPAFAVY